MIIFFVRLFIYFAFIYFSLGFASLEAEQRFSIDGEILAKEQVFIYRLGSNEVIIDPQLVDMGEASSSVARDLFEGLLNQDSDGNLLPGVALSWVVDQQDATYVFNLRKDALWSNGDLITAYDFVYAWRRAVDPAVASPYAWFMELAKIKNAAEIINAEKPIDSLGVTAIDDFTLKVELLEYLPYFAQMMTNVVTFPTHQDTIEKYGDEWVKPNNIVSNGAYILSEHIKGERLVRLRNENYWNEENTIIDKTIALFIDDENKALSRYLAGDIDRTKIPSGQYPDLKKRYPKEVFSFPQLCSYYYIFNLSDSGFEGFRDVRVRRAMNMVIDRKIIVEEILAGGQNEAYSFTPITTASFKLPSLEIESMSQDEREKIAKELIEQAGYGKGGKKLRFNLSYNTSKGHKKIADAMKQMWQEKLSIEAELIELEWDIFIKNRKEQKFDIARGAWCGDYNEASTFLNLVTTDSGYNDGRYSNSKVDELMQSARTTNDPQSTYSKIEEIIADEIPFITIYHYAKAYMLGGDLRGWPLNNAEQKWYSKDLYKIALQ